MLFRSSIKKTRRRLHSQYTTGKILSDKTRSNVKLINGRPHLQSSTTKLKGARGKSSPSAARRRMVLSRCTSSWLAIRLFHRAALLVPIGTNVQSTICETPSSELENNVSKLALTASAGQGWRMVAKVASATLTLLNGHTGKLDVRS